MIDIPASSSTQTALPVTTSLSNAAPSLNGTPTSVLPEEDEPYTIKCICNFQEDDGNTVFCESCDTWQHIECYYHGSKVPEVHNCVDCEPRSLDHKHATERQKLRRETTIADRKAKRPATKSHKKKPKDLSAGGTTANGWPPAESANGVNGLDRRAGSPRDQAPPAKRPKTAHRNSSSASSHPQVKSPSLAPLDTRRNGQPAQARAHSPSKSPFDQSHDFSHPAYSPDFLQLNQADPQEAQIQTPTNLFSTIAVVNSLSSWIQDPDACQRATNGRLPAEIFQRWAEPLESLARAELSQRSKELAAASAGTRPLCRFIVAESIVPLDGVIDELKGSIGYADDYRQDPSGRYRQLQHAEPLVFFHPHLPIFIDTRLEGTQLRYVRRSCRANASIKTIVTNGTECHFCFCATKTIEPGSEVSVGWDLGDQMREFIAVGNAQYRGDSASSEGLNRGQFDSLSAWVSKLLASHGGCACDDPQTCIFFAFDRRALEYNVNSHLAPANASRSKKPRKGKALSPLQIGEGPGRRAGSDGFKREEQDNDEDSRSTSESVRSKPHSRDLTPSNPYSGDARMNQAGMSDREKRKIAALEKTFEQMEEKDHQHKAYKKQKRSSGGSTATTPGVTASKQLGGTPHQPITPAQAHRPHYISTGTASRRVSGSPATDVDMAKSDFGESPTKSAMRETTSPVGSKSPNARSNYVDASMQTEPETSSDGTPKSSGKRPFIPLTKLLLMRCHKERVQQEENKKRKAMESTLESSPTVNGILTHQDGPSQVPAVGPATSLLDHMDTLPDSYPLSDLKQVAGNAQKMPIPEAGLEHTLSATQSVAPLAIKPPPPAWQSGSSLVSPDASRFKGFRSANLHVQLPPTPQFSNAPSTSSVNGTPTSATPSIAQSPFSLGYGLTGAPAFSPSVVQHVVQSSPVKKKLSLSDYINRSKVDTSTNEKGQPATSPVVSLKPSSSLVMEMKSEHALEGSAITDTPMAKDLSDPIDAAAGDSKSSD